MLLELGLRPHPALYHKDMHQDGSELNRFEDNWYFFSLKWCHPGLKSRQRKTVFSVEAIEGIRDPVAAPPATTGPGHPLPWTAQWGLGNWPYPQGSLSHLCSNRTYYVPPRWWGHCGDRELAWPLTGRQTLLKNNKHKEYNFKLFCPSWQRHIQQSAYVQSLWTVHLKCGPFPICVSFFH